MPVDMNMNTKRKKVIALQSNTIELCSVVQLLADSKHHEFAREWANEMYKMISKDSLIMISIISQMSLQGMELVEFVLESRIFNDIGKLIEVILEYDNIEFLDKITGEQIGVERIHKIIDKKENLEEVVSEKPWLVRDNISALEFAFYNTDEFKKKIIKLLNELNNEVFKSKFLELNDKYKEAVKDMNIKILMEEPKKLVQEAIGKKWPIKEYEEYIFIPSYFISPHHLMIYNKNTIITVYDMISNRIIKQEKGKTIAHRLSIISNKTRLEILRQIIAEPTYGKVLAAMLDLTTATISHHLEQLKAVNLINEHKVKNIKYFSANIENIDNLLEDAKNYLYNK